MINVAQWVPVQLIPQPDGKVKKVPLDYRTGRAGDAHDPALWLTHAAAVALGGPVGFVITPTDPYFFIDLDGIRIGDTWSPEALAVCAQFPGAYVEVSQSGRGLHIIGRYDGPRPVHSTRSSPLELYTGGRFVVITGTGAQGDAETVHTAALYALITARFTTTAPVLGAPLAWTSAPCPEWNGPVDDDDLISRASHTQSAATRLTGRASFADLFNGNVGVLAATYPSDNGVDAYNASAADTALAAHLMWWTGKDCERTERIMRRSALVRDKWDLRDDYLRERVIVYALARCTRVCQDRPPEPPASGPAPTPGPAPTAPPPAPMGFITPDMQRVLFAGACYVLDADKILLPGGLLIDATRFSRWFSGRFVLDAANQRLAKNAAEAFLNSEVNPCPRAMSTCFRPRETPGAIINDEGVSKVNRYWPVQVRRVQGDPKPFLDHLALILPVPRDRQIFISYMAACAQYVGVKFQYATLLQGGEGNGKTLMAKCVEAAVGMKFTEWPQVSEIGEKYNSWLSGSILAAVDDVHVTKNKSEVLEILKPMITSSRVSIRAMNTDRVMMDTCCNFMFTSNHRDGLPKHRGDRRLCAFFTAQQTKEDIDRDMPPAYCKGLFDWLERDGYAIVAEYLHTYQIPDEFNPALGIRAPETSTTAEAITASRGMVEQEINEAIEADRQGFRHGWVSSAAVSNLLDSLRMRIAPINMRGIMQSLGYDWHPGLPNGRCRNPVPPDNAKPKLFICKGHACAGLEGVAVERAYTAAQLDLGGVTPSANGNGVPTSPQGVTTHRLR